ncbi:jg25261, partial [Pararge aegeria aegeria]
MSDEESEMNFAAFQAVGGPGTHFVTTGGQMPKMQQNMTNNGTSLSQVVGMVGGVNMGDGVQYVRTIDGSSQQGTPQLISVPVTLPGAKPGDPQSIVQIQVLSPNVLQQQQPKYQMQIPIQGFQQ